MRRAALLFVLFACAAAAAADGGRVRVRRAAGPWTITVFTSPEPLVAGPADVSVLVQERDGGAIVLDADIVFELRGPGGKERAVAAGPGTNRLLESAVVTLATPGDWLVSVSVRRAGESARVSCPLPVGPAPSRLAGLWPLLAFPPFGVALFALHGALASSRRRGGRTRA
jgi:hypothetical protein